MNIHVRGPLLAVTIPIIYTDLPCVARSPATECNINPNSVTALQELLDSVLSIQVKLNADSCVRL